MEALRQDVVDAAAELAQAGPDHQTYLEYQLRVKRGRARRYERLFNVRAHLSISVLSPLMVQSSETETDKPRTRAWSRSISL